MVLDDACESEIRCWSDSDHASAAMVGRHHDGGLKSGIESVGGTKLSEKRYCGMLEVAHAFAKDTEITIDESANDATQLNVVFREIEVASEGPSETVHGTHLPSGSHRNISGIAQLGLYCNPFGEWCKEFCINSVAAHAEPSSAGFCADNVGQPELLAKHCHIKSGAFVVVAVLVDDGHYGLSGEHPVVSKIVFESRSEVEQHVPLSDVVDITIIKVYANKEIEVAVCVLSL